MSTWMLPPQARERVRWLVANRRKIEAVKLVLEHVPGLPLGEAKRFVEALPPVPPASLSPLSPDQVDKLGRETVEQLGELAARGEKTHAVKLVCARTGWSLKEAKAFVDDLWPARRRRDDGAGHLWLGG